MESLRDIRQNIKSIKSTQQIMLTMKMISSARIKRAQNAMIAARPFSLKLEGLIDDLRKDIMGQCENFDPALKRFFVTPEEAATGEKPPIGLVVITADKGLCGAFNALILRNTLAFLRENKDRKIYVFCVGKKGRDFISRLKMPNIEIYYEAVGIFPKVGFVHAEMLGAAVGKAFVEMDLSEVHVIYNDFKSMGSQTLTRGRILPFDFDISHGHSEEGEEHEDFLYEPGKDYIFKTLLLRHIKAVLYRVLLESQAAELSARMNAMDSASKNAGELVDALGIKLNKVRQSSITNEITEIVGAVEALSSSN
ncbi:F-type H+-transporting ATPase subunit gamma [Elusimicrobium posterum]|uniref:ATP synthase F1 subunit gamma n=1 Tax=Elusimicrobium posterum TaxID=3116653 RepID=UPI003C756198